MNVEGFDDLKIQEGKKMFDYCIFNGRRLTEYLSNICCTLMIIFAAGCGDNNSQPATSDNVSTDLINSGSASFSIQWHEASAGPSSANALVRHAINDCAGVASVTCNVYDESKNVIASGGPWPCENHGGRIEGIPAGTNRTFAVLGWDAEDGNIIYQGQTKQPIVINPDDIADAGTIVAYAFVPSGLAARTVSGHQINLAWDAFDEDFEVDGYRIYRDGMAVATSVALSYEDKDLSAGTQYCYTVAAYDIFGNESRRSSKACTGTPLKDTWFQDADGDSYGDPNSPTEAATPPEGYVADNTDCNDDNPTIYPTAPELDDETDNDCDGFVDEGWSTYYRDADGDQFGDSENSLRDTSPPDGHVADNTDCDDGDNTVYPQAPGIDDGKDNDCDGGVDESWDIYYRDDDGDQFGSPDDSRRDTTQPEGYVRDHSDCNDNNGSIHPGATEVCNNVDDNCDGNTDEGLTFDADGDGYTSIGSCIGSADDCEDNNGSIHPNATELCNGADDDCDGNTDEGVENTYYQDYDGDDFGHPSSTEKACTPPDGYVDNGDDCDDRNAEIHPGATELCNGADDDCDGSIDESVENTYYEDYDGDGFGDPSNTEQACTPPDGYVDNGDDCDDRNAETNPRAEEICYDKIDNNCDGQRDEGCVCSTTVMIGDNDGYGHGPNKVMDNGRLPENDDDNAIEPWVFYKQDADEVEANNGAQHTDKEPYDSRKFAFSIRFCPVDPKTFLYARFTLDVSGIQGLSFGNSQLLLDGQDFSKHLNQNQGIYGSNVIHIPFEPPDSELFEDGELRVEFIGGKGTDPNQFDPDAIAFDFFEVTVAD